MLMGSLFMLLQGHLAHQSYTTMGAGICWVLTLICYNFLGGPYTVVVLFYNSGRDLGCVKVPMILKLLSNGGPLHISASENLVHVQESAMFLHQLTWRAMVKLLRTAWCLWSSTSSVSPPPVVVGYGDSMHQASGEHTIP